jgi:hypothetical protein
VESNVSQNDLSTDWFNAGVAGSKLSLALSLASAKK